MKTDNNTKAKEIPDNFVAKEYNEETDKIAKKNLDLSMKLSGLLSMLEAYFTEYHQNRREIIGIAKSMVLQDAESDHQKSEINRKTKNQLNKLDNQADTFYKFTKRFSKEFNEIFGQTELEDNLIDAMERFWSQNVKIDANTVTIKEFKHN